MLKRVSALILSAVVMSACSEPIAPSDATPVPAGGQQSLLAELTCKADVAARSLTCAPASPSLGSGISPDLIIGGQNMYVQITSSNIQRDAITLSADVKVKNLTVQPWATADGSTPSSNGIRVFFHTGPTNGVTVANADGAQTYTASNQPYHTYSGAALGLDGILSSGETTTDKNWQFTLNGASTFAFQVYVVATLPDELGILKWTPSTVSQFGTFENVNAIWGASASDIWIGGTNGSTSLHHWNGSSWSPDPGAFVTEDVLALWGSSSTDVYAVGGTKIQRWDGVSWSDVSSGSTNSLLSVWGSSSTDVYAGGFAGTLVHSTGGAFSAVSGTGIGNEYVAAIWGTSSSNIYVGATNVYHYNGTSWSTVSAGISNVVAIWGSSAGDIWMGGGAQLVHYDGSWSAPVTIGNGPVSGIWGTSPTDVYMVNRVGEIWHFNGTSWLAYKLADQALLGVWGSGRTDVWAVGTDSTNFQYNRAFHGTR
jgi:hypothetical protein